VSELRKVELAGAPRAMGEAFGEMFREDIRRFADIRMGYLIAFVERYDPGRAMSRDEVLACAAQVVPAHREFDPSIWAEFEGIAHGAGLSLEELIVCNGLTDLRDFALLQGGPATGPVDVVGECTALLVPADRAQNGQPILAQTWDMHADAINFILVVHRKPDGQPETLSLTTVGCLCLIGMNSEGVCVGNNNLSPTDTDLGVNYLFTITHALQKASALDAIQAIEDTPRLSGHNYYAVDAHNVFNSEVTAKLAKRTTVTGEAFVHANHYLDEELVKLELPGYVKKNTNWRYDKLSEERSKKLDPLSMEDCWELLNHVEQGNVDGGAITAKGGGTVATVVQCPARRTTHICAGPPKPGNAEILTL
jgi:isopenicillin-N N-acyltransferase like protein